MKAWQIIILSLLVFSCKTERTVLAPNKQDFHFGSADFPTIYWGTIKNNSMGKYMNRRTIFLYFFDNYQVLYRLGSKECLGGNRFVSKLELDNDKLLISPDYRNSYRNWDNYEMNFFINEWKIKNDSILIGRNGEKLIKVPQDTKERIPVGEKETVYEYLNYYLKAYFAKEY